LTLTTRKFAFFRENRLFCLFFQTKKLVFILSRFCGILHSKNHDTAKLKWRVIQWQPGTKRSAVTGSLPDDPVASLRCDPGCHWQFGRALLPRQS